MKKNVLSLMLALAMLLPLLPTSALAKEWEYDPTTTPILDLLPTKLLRPAVLPTSAKQAFITATEEADTTAAEQSTDERVFQEIVALTESLTRGKTSDKEKMKAIYDWVTWNIEYDNLGTLIWAPMSEHFTQRSGRCGTYAFLCRLMGTLAGLTVADISGLSNEENEGLHGWNAVLLDGEWLFFDATWHMWDMDKDYHRWTSALIYDDIYQWNIWAGSSTYPDRLIFTPRWGFEEQCPAHLIIPETVTDVSNFYGCPDLERITFPDTVTYIGACGQNPKLRDVPLPDGLKELGNSAFAGCRALKSITLPDGMTVLGHLALSDTGISSITVPGSVTSVGSGAFYRCAELKSVTIGSGVSDIEDTAFMECPVLTDITIPNTVAGIGDQAFYGCTALESITIPEGVTTIGDLAFFDCTNLEWADLPDSLVSRGNGVFTGCPNLKSVKIPKGLTSIGIGAFQDRTDLTSMVIPDNITEISSRAFYGCTNLKSVTIPYGVTTIGNSAFWNCTALESITIPSSVTTIEYGAFANCASLKSVVIPPSVTSIGNSAFSGCKALADVTISEGVTQLGSDVFAETPWLNTWLNGQGDFSIVNGVLFQYQGKGGAVTIPSGITGIEGGAFSYCKDLTSVTIPESVTSIGEGAFFYCRNLTNVTIPESVTTIEERAFLGCTALKSVTIPGSVATIGGKVFEGCTGLTSVALGSGVASIGHHAFSNCEGLKSIVIPEGVTSIGNSAFSYCTSLESVYLPASLTTIEDYMFWGCGALESVTIPDSVTNIKYAAFLDSGLKRAYYTGTEEQWKAIKIGTRNDRLTTLLIRCNSPMPEMPAVPTIPAIISAGVDPEAAGTAYASTQTVLVDGKAVEFQCYALKDAKGSDTNYIKLRDLASVLNGTAVQFEVGWNGEVNIETGKAYTPNGSEMSTPYSGNRSYQRGAATTMIDGMDIPLQAFFLTDDQGKGYTYYKLRDLGQALGFQVDWSAEKGIFIETK